MSLKFLAPERPHGIVFKNVQSLTPAFLTLRALLFVDKTQDKKSKLIDKNLIPEAMYSLQC